MSEHSLDVFNSTPPWLVGKSILNLDEVTLHDEIQMFCKWVSPTKEEQMMRESVIVRISCVVCQLWPSAQVKTYGSYATQLYLPNSDVDLCVTGAPPGSQSLITLAEVLRSKELSTHLHVISSAKVPIIKLTDKVSGSIVDISLNHDVRTNELVNSYMERFPSLRPLTLILKLFLFQRRLHETYTGGLSSFSLLIVIVSFLQFHVPDSTSKNIFKITKSNLGTLLTDFFKFYGKQFDYEHMGISIRDSGSYFPKMSRDWYDPFNPCIFSLESPLDQTSDVGRGGFATPRVIAAFAKAYEELTTGIPRLSSVLVVDNTILERRSHIASLYTRQLSSSHLAHLSNRAHRSISAAATLQTVPPSPSHTPSVPIQPPTSESVSTITPPANLVPNKDNIINPLFMSTSAPAPLSPPSPPPSHTPIHISPTTSPRILAPIPAAMIQPPPSHPTIAGFTTRTPSDSSDTDTDGETETYADADADIDTDSGDQSLAAAVNSMPNNGSELQYNINPMAAKPPFYNCQGMSSLGYSLRAMQYLQIMATSKSGKSKHGKRVQRLHRQLDASAGNTYNNTNNNRNIVFNHNSNNNNNTNNSTTNSSNNNNNNNNNNNTNNNTNNNNNINNKKANRNKRTNCINSNPPKLSIITEHSPPTPTPASQDATPPNAPPIATTPDSAATTPAGATTTTRSRRNSNPQHNRRNSNPLNRRNNAQSRRRNSNSSAPLSTSLPTTSLSCAPILEVDPPNATTDNAGPTDTPSSMSSSSDSAFSRKGNFRIPSTQRWAPKAPSNPSKKT